MSRTKQGVPYAQIGSIERLKGMSFLPDGWTGLRVGVEGEGNCGIHAINYALNTYDYKTILHRGCPHDRPCSSKVSDQLKDLRNPGKKYGTYTTYVLRRISEKTRHQVAHSFTPSSAQCALRCYYERHEPTKMHCARKNQPYHSARETLRDMYQWISEVAFRQVSYILDVDILIFTFERQNFNCGYISHKSGFHPILVINWIGRRHFEAITFVYNLDDKLRRCNNDLTETVRKHGVSCVDHDSTRPEIQDLYRALYEARAHQCARFFDPEAQCKTNRPLPLKLPTAE